MKNSKEKIYNHLLWIIGERWIFFLVSGVFLIGGTVYCLLTEKMSLVLLLAQKRTTWLNETFLLLTRLGEEHIFIVIILSILFFSYRKALTLTIAGFSTIVASYLVKLLFSQPRPYTILEKLGEAEKLGHIANYHFHNAYNSFPSGHTFSAFALFTTLALVFKPGYIQILCVLAAIAGGFSRIYLGQHFACDVVFGSFLGILTGIFSYLLVFTRWKNEKDDGLIRFFKRKNQV